jgi:hypothetical protein
MRFTLKDEATGTILNDMTDKYSKKEKGFVAGNFYAEFEKAEDSDYLFPPGKYVVDFYHNGELIDSAGFKVNAPEVKIIDVTLANEVNQDYEPISVTNEFMPADIFHASVKLNNRVTGNTVSATWYKGDGEYIDSADYEITEDYYKESYIDFNLSPVETWPPGNYYIEIYLNDSIYGKYDFSVTGAEAGETADEASVTEITFNQNNIYANDIYQFAILYPDGWAPEESTDEVGLSVLLWPPDDNVEVSMWIGFIVEGNFQPDQLEALADEIAVSGIGMTQIDKVSDSGELLGFPYEEYDYLLKDEDGTEYEAMCLMIKKEGDLFIFFGINTMAFDETAYNAYVTMLQSLTFSLD